MNKINIHLPPVKCRCDPFLGPLVQLIVAIIVKTLIEYRQDIVVKINKVEVLILVFV